MIGRSDIEAARMRIAGYVRRTPVHYLEASALSLKVPVTLKLELLQATGSFKLRGAFNNLLSADLTEAGVVAISGGNHGSAVAYAATSLGVASTVYVPQSYTTEVKLERMRSFGANVVAVPGTIEEAFKAYTDHAAQTDALEVHPYDSDLTLAGQGTVGVELSEQVEIDTLLVSVGGGGLIGGIMSWFQKDLNVVSVETEETSCLAQSLKIGDLVSIIPGGISASGLGASVIGDRGWQAARQWLGGQVVVSDAATTEAQKRLWEATRIVGEPGAATALAALTSGAYVPEKDERVGVLLCGGNAAPDWFVD